MPVLHFIIPLQPASLLQLFLVFTLRFRLSSQNAKTLVSAVFSGADRNPPADFDTFTFDEATRSTYVALSIFVNPYVVFVHLGPKTNTSMVFNGPGYINYTVCHPKSVIDLVVRLVRSGNT